MKAHTVTLDLYDQGARLVAVDFETRRVLVTWGSGIESCTSGYEFRECSWRSRLRCPATYTGCDLAGVDVIGARYRFAHSVNFADPPAPLQTSTRPHGERTPCQIFPPGEWHRFEAPQSWSTQMRGGRIVSRQNLGPLHDDLLFTPAIPIRPVADDPRVELAALADCLRALDIAALSEGRQLRALGAWLLAMRTKLMHGFELSELAQEHHATPLNGPRIDDVLKPLCKAGVVRPYLFDPTHASRIGLKTYAGNELDSARYFGSALAGEMRDERMNRGDDYSDEEWSRLCQSLGVLKLSSSKATRYGGATGAIFWYFTRGKKFADLPRFIL